MPADPTPLSVRLDRARRAHAALRRRGHPSLDAAFERWSAMQTEDQGDEGADPNAYGQARAFAEAHSDALARASGPITIEGVSPPWLALEIARVSALGETEYRPAIRLVQADAGEFFDGCAAADLEPLLGDPRVEAFIGPDAGARLASQLADAETAIAGPVITLPTTRLLLEPGLTGVLRVAQLRQQQSHAAHLAALRQRDNAEPAAVRLARLRTNDRPRRVALIAGRFTRVLGPTTRDLADAFERAGWRARLLTEPSDHARLSPLAYSRTLDEFDPDLIVAANHTRADIDRVLGQPVMPVGVPWVTWVQDAMPHLLGRGAGEAVGPLDLVVGHVSDAMLRGCAFPRERTIIAPMVASETKFGAPRERHAGEPGPAVAAFTNHSETPDAMRARLIRESLATAGLAEIVERLADAALEIADRPMHLVHAAHACREAVDRVAPGLEPAVAENLSTNVAMRLVDRVARQRTLEWARQICERRGWSMRVHGAGWSSHPTLAIVAGEPIPHGPALASAYRRAGVTLHAGLYAPMHQRLIECVLAGGLPAYAVSRNAVSLAVARIGRSLVTRHRDLAEPGTDEAGRSVLRFARADRPEADRAWRLGALTEHTPGTTPTHLGIPDVPLDRYPDAPDELDADRMIGLLELGFTTPDGLEALIERALTDPAWRARESARIAERARGTCTHASLVRRIDAYYGARADAEAPRPSRAAV